ncbi:MAG TPA: hypothetical protein VHD14_03180 [Pseudolabrys sp.]|jgi:hypothetical protein|nr:hypothetical protein [Pseudolabrys sp.]
MDREIRILGLTALASVILLPVLAAAQTPPAAKPPAAPQQNETRDPKACAQAPQSTVGSGAVDEKSTTLSDKLARSDGVICPPAHVDPDIKAPTPPGGAMPVIPPPGSPGGDPNVRPK